MIRLFFLLFLLPLFSSSQAFFSEVELLTVVKKFHPLARNASLGVSLAKAGLLSSRGAFDPVLKTEGGRKEFDGVQYYSQQQTELKIPTWYGLDFYAGAETINGQRINPEETKGRLTYAGVSFSPLQNLMLDKRRATLQQARLFVNSSEAEQDAALNTLLRDAAYAYWEWWEAVQVQSLADSSLSNARLRFELVKKTVALGERAAIDTVEAFTQVQQFTLAKIDADTKRMKSALELSAYLWTENATPYTLPADAMPQLEKPPSAPLLETLLACVAVHPEIQQYQFKLASLQVAKKLAFQSLLPDVDLKYQQLGRSTNFLKTATVPVFQNNYRFGFSLAIPLRLSAGRGDYQKAKIKIEQATFDRIQKQMQLQTKLQQAYTEWQQTATQIAVQQNAVANYAALQRGEETRFFNGESSLFFINAREQKTWEGKQKLVELQAKNRKALANVKWAAGLWVP